MYHIDRRTRESAVALVRLLGACLVAALLAACSDGATAPVGEPPPVTPPPVTPPPAGAPAVTGTWVTHRVDEKPMPAVVKSGTDAGVAWELHALADTLIVRADGTWEQRVRVRQTQSDGFVFNGGFWDRGVWTRTGSALAFESTWIQNVRFTGSVTTTGELVVNHDYTLDDGARALQREMKR